MSETDIFDRRLLDARRRRRVGDPEAAGARFLLRAVAAELAERLSLVDRRFALAIDLCGHTGEAAAALWAGGQVDRILRVERDAVLLAQDDEQAPTDGLLRVVGDEEALPIAADVADLVVSALSLHLTNDTPGVIVQAGRTLKPDGLFLAAALGGETLTELRAALLAAETEIFGGASPRVAPFIDIRDAGGLLQRAGLALPVVDQDRITVRYDSMFELMRDLRLMGMSNMLRQRLRRPASRRFFLRAAELYAERFSDPDRRVRATFDVVYLSGWKPHESQQKPLKPGSAKARLAEALGDRSSPSAATNPGGD